MTDRPVIVTGAGGFIGRALCRRLAADGVPVAALLRRPVSLPAGIEQCVVPAFDGATDWRPLLAGGRAVVHLASRAHAPAGTREESWSAADATAAVSLAHAARDAGIERLVLMSSIKAHGPASGNAPVRADQPLAPVDPYGRAKRRIEEAMRAAAENGPPLVVLRPPLVYGPGVKANFLRLLRLVDRGLPLPLASIDNRRGMIFLGNLVDLVVAVLTHPAAPGRAFLLRDDEEVSTPDLVLRIARQLGRPARLLPCPPPLLRGAAWLVGSADAVGRLVRSRRVDDEPTRRLLGWRPRRSLDEGLAETCHWFRAGRR